jgi:neutral ceramidase
MLRAGFGKSVITPKVGARLVGYANRTSPSTGVHDDLHARALVVEANGKVCALCAVELCYLRETQVSAVRQIVEKRTGVPRSQIFLCAVHTHSGPDDQNATEWEKPLPELIADAVVQAINALRPARIGAGSGFLYGWSINRRWLDRPIDPFLGVIRVDGGDGEPMGVVANFGCHAVVLGYDNLLISADWPGVTSSAIEEKLGAGAVCIITQGGSGDANPLTRQVRSRLQSGIPIGTMEGRVYFGDPRQKYEWHIGDRGGGTFDEAQELGEAVAAEITRVANTIGTASDRDGLWTAQITLDGSRQPNDPPYAQLGEAPTHILERPISAGPNEERMMEIMMIGIEKLDIILVGEPGEVFAETVVNIRRDLQALGYLSPWVVGYANGWQLYLPPLSAYLEGGYEVNWATNLGLSPKLQDRIWDAIHPTLRQHVRTR